MALGPYAAAVVNGDVGIGGLLDGLAENGAYGDVRKVFPGYAYLLLEERVSGELLHKFFHFRVVGYLFVQADSLR